jgi:hypothetical protein
VEWEYFRAGGLRRLASARGGVSYGARSFCARIEIVELEINPSSLDAEFGCKMSIARQCRPPAFVPRRQT